MTSYICYVDDTLATIELKVQATIMKERDEHGNIKFTSELEKDYHSLMYGLNANVTRSRQLYTDNLPTMAYILALE